MSSDTNSDLLQLSSIFESRLGNDVPGRLRQISAVRTLSTDERATLIGRFASVLRRLSELMSIPGEPGMPVGLDPLLFRLMDIITESLDADRSTLFIHDPHTGELVSRVAQGGLVDEIRLREDEGIAGSAFTHAQPILLADAYADPRFNPAVDRRTGYRTDT